MRQEMNWSRKKKATTLKIIRTDSQGLVLNFVVHFVPNSVLNFATRLEPC
jgi:hypothetical protein